MPDYKPVPLKTFDLFLEGADYSEFKVYAEEEEDALPAVAAEPSPELGTDLAAVVDVEAPLLDVEAPATSFKVLVLSAVDENAKNTPQGVAAAAALVQKLSGADVTELKLSQLNIQSAPSSSNDKEPQDGMMMIYQALEGADVLVMNVEITHERFPNQLNSVLDRLHYHYKNQELRNLVFASMLSGDSTKKYDLRDQLVASVFKLGVLTSVDCHFFCGNDWESSMMPDVESLTSTLAAALTQIAESTATLRQAPVEENPIVGKPVEDESDDIVQVQDYDTFAAQGGAPAIGDSLPATPSVPEPVVEPVSSPTIVPIEEPTPMEEMPLAETPAEEEEIYMPMLFNEFERSRIPGYVPEVPGVAFARKPTN